MGTMASKGPSGLDTASGAQLGGRKKLLMQRGKAQGVHGPGFYNSLLGPPDHLAGREYGLVMVETFFTGNEDPTLLSGFKNNDQSMLISTCYMPQVLC